jgi:hypothetical protein
MGTELSEPLLTSEERVRVYKGAVTSGALSAPSSARS